MGTQEKAAGAVGAGTIPDWLAPILERLRRNDGAYKIKGGKRARFKPERAPTEDEIADHFNGGAKFVGGYLMDLGGRFTRLGVVDLDDHDGTLGWESLQARADRVTAELNKAGLRAARFRSSGGHGIHLWVYWDTEQDAHSVRMLLKQCVMAACLQVKAGVAEVFPAQDFIPEDACGTPVFWPVERLDAGDWLPSQAVPIKAKEPPPERPHVGACSGDMALLRLALGAISNEGPGQPYGEGGEFGWLAVGMALHAASGGSAEGLGLWHEWSGRSPKYDAADVERRWSSFKPGGGITAATILKEAARYGFNEHQARLQILTPQFQKRFPAQEASLRNAMEDQGEPLDLWQEQPPRKFTAGLMP
ncbi:PriCT-2 domain-containing protein, partial [Devosia sp.]|uniref:PriCT-2 domain-containing protein n=1 Tax=Devosia sp. TaxID=1871048 RepID=UPI002FCB45B3